MNAKDFYDWKRHPVTQVVFSQLQGRIRDLQEHLTLSAGLEPIQDREYVGAIKAYRDMLEIQWEGEETAE